MNSPSSPLVIGTMKRQLDNDDGDECSSAKSTKTEHKIRANPEERDILTNLAERNILANVAERKEHGDSFALLKSHYPHPLRLSEHPNLSSLLTPNESLAVREVFIDKIETLFDSGFLDDFMDTHVCQVLVLRALHRSSSLDDINPQDTWLLFLPSNDHGVSVPCALKNCDVLSFPRLEVCLFHHEIQILVERSMERYEADMEAYRLSTEAWSGHPTPKIDLQKYPFHGENLVGQIVHSIGLQLDFTLPCLDEFRKNPALYLNRLQPDWCWAGCGKLRVYKFPDYDVSKLPQTEWFCAKHNLQGRDSRMWQAIDTKCSHRSRGMCHCLIESAQHWGCCHPCFVKGLYLSHMGEPFPNFFGSDDVLNVMLKYVRPEVWFGLLMSW